MPVLGYLFKNRQRAPTTRPNCWSSSPRRSSRTAELSTAEGALTAESAGVRNIFLVGLPGAGKTTVGRILARQLGQTLHRFRPRDRGSAPAARFRGFSSIEGEASFRRPRSRGIRDLTAAGRHRPGHRRRRRAAAEANRASLQGARPRDLPARQRRAASCCAPAHDKNRPLLQTADPRRQLEELTAQREPLYREMADFVIDTGRPNVQSMVQTILVQLAALETPARRACAQH